MIMKTQATTNVKLSIHDQIGTKKIEAYARATPDNMLEGRGLKVVPDASKKGLQPVACVVGDGGAGGSKETGATILVRPSAGCKKRNTMVRNIPLL